MNTFAIYVSVLALACVGQAIDDFGFGGRDDFFGSSRRSAANRGSFFSGGRFRDREDARASDDASSRLAVGQTNKDAFAARDRKAGENFLKAQDQELFKANHDLSKKSNFGLKIVDQKAHDESSNVAYKKGNQIAKGDRFKVDQGVKAASFNDNRLKAAKDREQDSFFAKDFEADNERKAKEENQFEDFNLFEEF